MNTERNFYRPKTQTQKREFPRWIFFLAFILALAVLAAIHGQAQSREPSIIKVSHLNPAQVGISCKNGADPTGTKIGGTLIISCGQ